MPGIVSAGKTNCKAAIEYLLKHFGQPDSR
jgi:hypothetical protein